MASIHENYFFPLEIWENVVDQLDKNSLKTDEDIFNLTQVNKEFRLLFTGNLFWRGRIEKLYYKNPTDPFLDVPAEINKLDSNLFKHGMERYYIEKSIRMRVLTLVASGTLDKLDDADDDDILGAYFTTYISPILKHGHYTIHAMKKIRTKFDDEDFIHFFLLPIQHIIVYKRLKRDKYISDPKNLELCNDAENVLFELSYSDPAFEQLCFYRKHVLQKTYDQVRFDSKFDSNDPLGIITLIQKHLTTCIDYHKYTGKLCVESLSLLRVYSGEAIGASFIIIAIIQKIAKQFNIKTKLSVNLRCLIICDSKFGKFKPYLKFTDLLGCTIQSGLILQGKASSSYDVIPLRNTVIFYKTLKLMIDKTQPLKEALPALVFGRNRNVDKKEIYPKSKIECHKDLSIMIELFFYRDKIRGETLLDRVMDMVTQNDSFLAFEYLFPGMISMALHHFNATRHPSYFKRTLRNLKRFCLKLLRRNRSAVRLRTT
ncbi:Mitochondrial distribution and morphology protein 30 [Wickerhamomyces ciferrii]|uniref:Mitochondrial distribution and morphology protein 30 n=1 Tax=Wickerhamomyces ciferrii (strain ATCC 14091 / BCRC 22168 / CBS 111 / JCM 3599 / NBRC 0793 / NRRL Y-1031 F-60-10) TaxID=1206466 RepID=K0KQV3_WICCF|nr:Mitochondrial distribution and morphology protein 30 [Wickerhamomyces ciferrii]CCH44507.1 Mitochondrial distribution and morphology protein 30 [Wickerhamomyces ciferrii]